MKNKINKILTTMLLFVITVLTMITKTNAAPQTITLGGTEIIDGYVSGVKFTTKTTTDGKYLYCLNINKKTAKYTTATLVGEKDAGVAAIILNGYPNKSITGDRLKDYYITQTAIWWYLDDTDNGTNLSYKFKTTGSDPYNLRPRIKELVNIGKKAKSIGYQEPYISLQTNNYNMQLNGDYYVSDEISLKNYKNISNYTITLENQPEGTKILNLNGQEQTTFNVNDKFIIKVPYKNVNSTNVQVKVNVSAEGKIFKAYEYKPSNDTMQPVTPAIIAPEIKNVTDSINLSIQCSKVTIIKLDKRSNKELAGATLALKDTNGKTITTWVSTTSGHIIRNLSDGVYILEEIKAPEGYKLNKEQIRFTVSDGNRNITIKIYNEPKTTVVNILKVNKNNNKPLAGATMTITNSNGDQIAKFVTTTEPFVITNLQDGTYTLSEIEAPKGYLLSNEKIQFTIDDNHLTHQIIFGNIPEIKVPDTATSVSIISMIVGILIITSGIGYIIKNAK